MPEERSERLVVAAGLRTERVGSETVVLDGSMHLVHRLTGPAAEVLRAAEDGVVPAEIPARLRPAVAALREVGVLVPAGVPGVRVLPLDRTVARRRALGLAAASAAGVATFALPSAAVAASTVTPASGVLSGGSEYAATQPDALDQAELFDYHRFATPGTFSLTANADVTAEIVLVGGGGKGSGGPGGGGGQVILITTTLNSGSHSVVVGAGATSATGGSSSFTNDAGSVLATAGGGGGASFSAGTAGQSPGYDVRAFSGGPFAGGGKAGGSYGGGGGAGGVGSAGGGGTGGAGGSGRFVGGFFPLSAPATRFGGGGGGYGTSAGGTASDGGGAGATTGGAGTAGAAASGGGGGGAFSTSGNGGSGLVVVRVTGIID